MIRWLMIGIGSAFTVSGVIVFFLPVPLGIPLMLIGVPILLRHSPRSRRIMIRGLHRFPRLHERLRKKNQR